MPKKSRRIVLPGILLATMSALGQVALAQAMAPRPIDQRQPSQPTNARGLFVDGWAVVRYSVLQDGTTENVRVLDIVPPSADPLQTQAAVEQWAFAPATEHGEPVDWHNNEAVVMFDDVGDAPAAAGTFRDTYAKISDMIAAHQYDEARKANEDLLNDLAIRQSDLELALAQATIIRIGQMDYHSALRSIRLATDPRLDVSGVGDKDRLIALRLRLQVEAQLGRTRDAIETVERIDSAVEAQEANALASMAEDLKHNWNDTEILQVLGRVDDQPWRIDAGRRIFTIDNVDGRVRTIEAECDHRRLSLNFQADVEWQLPEALGDCVLFVEASRGTTFSFFALLPAE